MSTNWNPASLAITAMRATMKRVHSSMFGLADDDLDRAYFQYLAQYKIAIFVFNLVPYFALRLIG